MTKKIMILLAMFVIGIVTVSAESFEKMLDTFMQHGTYVKIIDSERHKTIYIPKSSLGYIIDDAYGFKIAKGNSYSWVVNNTNLIHNDDPKLTPISLDKNNNLILKARLP